MASGRPQDFYGDLADALADRQDSLRLQICRTLLTSGIDGMWMTGIYVTADGKVVSTNCERDLRCYPPGSVRGTTFFQMRSAGSRLQAAVEGRLPGLRKGATEAFHLAARLARKRGLRRFYLCHNGLQRPPKQSRVIAAEAGVDVPMALRVSMVQLAGLSAAAVSEALGPWDALVLYPNTGGLFRAARAFRKIGPGKEVYLYSWRADRYLAGFYAAAAGAAGCLVDGAYRYFGGPYSGFYFKGQGMLALGPDGSLSPTVATLRLCQAKDDFEILRRCEALVKAASKARVPAGGLAHLVDEIKAHAAAQEKLQFSSTLLRTSSATAGQLEAWRTGLLEEADKLNQALKRR